MINIYNILLGHKFVCVAFGMHYYPFAEVTLLTLTQTISVVTYFILRVCGCKYNWISIFKGLVYILNVIILSLAVYGMTTRVPRVDEVSCFTIWFCYWLFIFYTNQKNKYKNNQRKKGRLTFLSTSFVRKIFFLKLKGSEEILTNIGKLFDWFVDISKSVIQVQGLLQCLLSQLLYFLLPVSWANLHLMSMPWVVVASFTKIKIRTSQTVEPVSFDRRCPALIAKVTSTG